jgi:BTB/POZ domain
MQCLPVWEPLVIGANSRLHSVAAIKAVLLPSRELFYNALTPDVWRSRFVQETPSARKVIKKLGGVELNVGEYVLKYVVPHLPKVLEEIQLRIFGDFLTKLHQTFGRRKLKSAQLIPDRTGRLRIGKELYSPTNSIFINSFGNRDTHFPHQTISHIPLEKFGIQSTLTKSNILTCVRSLERDVRSNEGDDNVWARCYSVWIDWNSWGSRENWNMQELNEIANIKFVPVLRSVEVTGYRDVYMQSIVPNTITTLNEVISPEYIAIAWTQRIPVCTKPAKFLDRIEFSPSVENVVDHLVSLANVFASKCTIQERAFFDDLAATYSFLSHPSRILKASTYLLGSHSDKALWLNEGFSLTDIDNTLHQNKNPETTIDSLIWLRASSILHGVPYDLPTHELYSAKSSLQPYGKILRACGSHVVESIKANTEIKGVENHGNKMLESIRTMLGESDNMSDMKIIVGRQEYQAHRLLLGTVSSYFRRLSCGDWKENSTGILNLDEKSYTSDSVHSVIEWVYNGFLTLDDGNLESLDDVQNRLDHYLDILELSNVWDIPDLKSHVESRILTYAHVFIRVENVSDVFGIASSFNASQLREFCQRFIERNKTVVKLVEDSEA